MGTLCEIQLIGDSPAKAKYIADLAFADILRLEAKFSRYREDSFVAEINRVAACGGSIAVDDETAGLINYAYACYQQSDGLFDISSGILRDAWRFTEAVVPNGRRIAGLLDKVGLDKVDWNPPVLTFTVSGMALDFGGIVKEYAADRVAELCRRHGAEHGLVNLGGDVAIIGSRIDGQPWKIGISHPRQKHALLTSIELQRGAVASSGDYERCILVDGVRYSHILNPKTGWPIKRMASVTVVGDLCVVAGSASTIAMLMEERGVEWLQGLGLPYAWTDVDGRQGGSLLD